ncbi:MAG: WD40 repeat domain-containing protein [Deltaproteobacteria bacterium]|nr:MAG: WD40 repeat domain-containing protein [Deltaproteobacteria bacterium]
MKREPFAPNHNNIPFGLRRLHILRGHSKQIGRIAWSHDGQKLASPSDDGTIRIWDPLHGNLLHILKDDGEEVYGVSWSPDNQTLAVGSRNETITFWDPATGQKLPTSFEVGHIVWGLQHSPCGRWLAASSTCNDLLIWDLQQQRQLTPLEGHSSIVTSVSWSPDGKRLATTSDDAAVRVWDLASRECLHVFDGHANWSETVAWSPDQTYLVSGDGQGQMRFWDLQKDKELRPMEKFNDEMIVWIQFSCDGSLLAVKSLDATVRFWYTHDWRFAAELPEATTSFIYTGAAFHPSAPYLATLGGNHNIIRIWDYSHLLTLRRQTWEPFLDILHQRIADMDGTQQEWREHIEDSLFED